MKRTNIMLGTEQHKTLKSYAQKRGRTLGGLVREAVDTAYKKRDPIEERRAIALGAYKEGFISLGKLAEIMGLDPVTMRAYLHDKGIAILGQDKDEISRDASHA
mgnify:CR=1 FL=1